MDDEKFKGFPRGDVDGPRIQCICGEVMRPEEGYESVYRCESCNNVALVRPCR